MMYYKTLSCIVVALLPNITPVFSQIAEAFRADTEKEIERIETDTFEKTIAVTEKQLLQLKNMAKIFKDNGQYSKAKLLFEEVLTIMEKMLPESDPMFASLWNNLAIIAVAEGRYPDADDLYAKVAKIRTEMDHDAVPFLGNLAYLRCLQGRYSEAELYIGKALEILELIDPDMYLTNTAKLKNTLAAIYTKQGRYPDARSHVQQSLEILQAIPGGHPDIPVLLNNLAYLDCIEGYYRTAEQRYERAFAILKKNFDEKHTDLATIQSNLASLNVIQGRYPEAEQHYKRALMILSEEHPISITILNNLAYLYQLQGCHAEAKQHHNRAIAIYKAKTMLIGADVGCELYWGRSLLYRTTDRPKCAVKDLKQAMILSLDARKNISESVIQQAIAFEGYYYIFETMVNWQYDFSQNGDEKNYDINEVYEAMELSRARGLHELIAQYMQPKDFLKDMPEAEMLLKEEQDARIQVNEFSQQLNFLSTRTDMCDLQMENEYERLGGLLVDAEQRWWNADNKIKSLIYEKFLQPVPLAKVKKQLESDKCLALEYLIGNENSYLLVYGFKQKPILFPLIIDETQAALFDTEPGPLTVEKLNAIFQNGKDSGVLQLVVAPFNIKRSDYPNLNAVQFSNFLSNFTREEVPELTLQLHRKLVALWPILIPDEELRSKIISDQKVFDRILILPDGPLTKFPFEMLVVNNDPRNSQYLLDKGAATLYAPSAGIYYKLLTLREDSGIKSVLTVSDPIYEKLNDNIEESIDSIIPHRGKRLINQFGHQLDRLKCSSDEREKIVNACNETVPKIPFEPVLDREKATVANVRNNVAGRSLVHLACHGKAGDEYGITYGALALTPGNPNDPKDDGVLELWEIFNLDLKSCELAILSACYTNVGMNQQGEGTWALSRGMLVAGSRRVVTTNWKVSDAVSAELVSNFAKDVITSNPRDYDIKLRAAQKKTRDNNALSHPFYWASFVLVGTY